MVYRGFFASTLVGEPWGSSKITLTGHSQDVYSLHRRGTLTLQLDQRLINHSNTLLSFSAITFSINAISLQGDLSEILTIQEDCLGGGYFIWQRCCDIDGARKVLPIIFLLHCGSKILSSIKYRKKVVLPCGICNTVVRITLVYQS